MKVVIITISKFHLRTVLGGNAVRFWGMSDLDILTTTHERSVFKNSCLS